ncbi:MAG: NAD(P)H-dependent oxidoreductase [bacterium]
MNITLVLSSVRENRLANNVFKKVKTLIGDRFTFTLVDPMDYNLPLLNKRYFEMKEPEEKFKKLHDIFMETDGFIIITAEYNHGMPPALKNMLDHFGPEFKYKSCGIVSYSDGPIGGARSCEQLRMVCSTLGMPPIPIAPAWGVADKADQPAGESFVKNFERQFGSFIEQFFWYTEAYVAKRKSI